jgi:hypothetical protein
LPPLDRKNIESSITVVRGRPVLLDADLAGLFGTETKKLNQQVKRNIARFDEPFAFQLTRAEFADLRSQNVTASRHGGRRTPPWAFTEHGVAMAATVLTSPRAVEAVKLIIDVFVSSRRQMLSGAGLPAGAARVEARRDRMKRKLARLTESILNAEIGKRDGTRVKDEVETLTTAVLDNVKAQLAARTISNETLVAEIHRKMAEAEKLRADARKTHAEADEIDIRNLKERLALLTSIEATLDESDPRPLLAAMDALATPPPASRRALIANSANDKGKG